MKSYSPEQLHNILNKLIEELSANKKDYVKDEKYHTRRRRLSFEDTIHLILEMSGGTINTELLSHFNSGADTPSASAFVQQRSKIRYSAFETLFRNFNAKTNPKHTYNGYRILAVDGSDIHIPTNKEDTDSFQPGINGKRPYNLLHLNAIFDVCTNTYVDALIQKRNVYNENQALADMLGNLSSELPAIIMADRGYESYSAPAHIQEKGMNYLFRVKEPSSKCGIANSLELPEGEFDVFIDMKLVAGRSKKHKELCKNKNEYRYLSNYRSQFFFKREDGTIDREKIYHLPFRIVRFAINEEKTETVITNLPKESFSADDLKKLYSMRWGIETSFRHLKYKLGLLNFHAKKTDSIYQEIFAHLIMYNFVSLAISGQKTEKTTGKYEYKSSFADAVHACRNYIRGKISPEDVIRVIQKYLTPVRPGRKAERRKKMPRSATNFNYREA